MAKMKREDVEASPGLNWKEEVFVLLTWPVGPCGPAAVVGIATKPFGATFTMLTLVLPVTPKRVAVLVPWFEVQNGLVGLCDKPHGFTSNESLNSAIPETSETRLVWIKGSACA